ncbi:alpha/beta hydrolase [Comamonas sp. GB3 AK4-5]|uniref:alpha/beta hydrolase n=1 Tax=Comamonas sp. GB3 AK4-5 TaxID=3231487 RepID=UPI00351F14D9
MRLLGCALLLALCSGCTSIPSPSERWQAADALAGQQGWQHEQLRAGAFHLALWRPASLAQQQRLTIYIEGDGFAWVTPAIPSADPTPRDPVALRLALLQPQGHAVYLARPCQYVDAEHTGCPSMYWTNARFSEAVITATDQAVDALKSAYAAQHITLVSYSGGAAVAALVAARRQDVDQLVSVAGNLDPHGWVQRKGLAPLRASLNPVEQIAPLAGIRQWHYTGGRDAVLPPALAQDFAQRFAAAQRPTVVVLPAFDHHCCWAQQWPALWTAMDLGEAR